MKKIVIALPIAVFCMLMSSCEKINGKGEVISESREVSGYHSVSLEMSADVELTQGDTWSCRISAQDNIMSKIMTSRDGDALIIKLKKGIRLGHHDPIIIYLTAPSVTNLDVDGSGSITVMNDWSGSSLSASISGSGKISIDQLTTGLFTADISGSGDISAQSGSVTREDLKISGSGNIDVRQVTGNEVYTNTSGSGETDVNALTMLDVTISGSGDVYYFGNPSINTHISGSGNIHRL